MHALNIDRKLQIHTVGFFQKLDVPAFPDWCQIGPDHPRDSLKIAAFRLGRLMKQPGRLPTQSELLRNID